MNPPPREEAVIATQVTLFEVDGYHFPAVKLAFSGGVPLDPTDGEILDLLRLGEPFTLSVTGRIKAKKAALGFDQDGNEDAEKRLVTVTLVVDSISLPD